MDPSTWPSSITSHRSPEPFNFQVNSGHRRRKRAIRSWLQCTSIRAWPMTQRRRPTACVLIPQIELSNSAQVLFYRIFSRCAPLCAHLPSRRTIVDTAPKIFSTISPSPIWNIPSSSVCESSTVRSKNSSSPRRSARLPPLDPLALRHRLPRPQWARTTHHASTTDEVNATDFEKYAAIWLWSPLVPVRPGWSLFMLRDERQTNSSTT